MDEPEGNEQQHEEQRNVQQPPPPIEGGNQAINGSTGGNHGDQKKPNRLQQIEAACAVLLVIITGTYTYYAAGQLHKMRRATVAAENAAIAAKSAADTAIQTMHIGDRAWVNVSTGQAPMTDGSPLVIPVTIVNNGKTTAFNVVGRMVVNLLPVNTEPDYVYKMGHPSYAFDVRALAPDHPQKVDYAALPKYLDPKRRLHPIMVTPKLREDMGKGYTQLVVHLRLTYDDIFGISHWVQFCASASAIIPGQKVHSANDTCGQYNDMDRNF